MAFLCPPTILFSVTHKKSPGNTGANNHYLFIFTLMGLYYFFDAVTSVQVKTY